MSSCCIFFLRLGEPLRCGEGWLRQGEPKASIFHVSHFALQRILSFAMANSFASAKVGLCRGEPVASILHSLASQRRSSFFALANCFAAAKILLRHSELVLQTIGGSSCLDFCPFLYLIFFQCLQNIKK